MKNAVAIVIDDVLRRGSGQRPIPEGIALYRSLTANWNVVLLGDQDDQAYEGSVNHFLMTEELLSHSRVSYGDTSSIDLGPRRVRQVLRLRNSGLALAFVVEPDPGISARMYAHGFSVMHWMHAMYTRPQWRPDYQHDVRPWDELVQQETELKAIRAADKRTT